MLTIKMDKFLLMKAIKGYLSDYYDIDVNPENIEFYEESYGETVEKDVDYVEIDVDVN
jgi:hypothetical protein